MSGEIHRVTHCGIDKDPVICKECAYDAAVLEDAARAAAKKTS